MTTASPAAAMAPSGAARPGKRGRAISLAVISSVLITATALLLVPVGMVTLFRLRRLYSTFARHAARAVLRLSLLKTCPADFPSAPPRGVLNRPPGVR